MRAGATSADSHHRTKLLCHREVSRFRIVQSSSEFSLFALSIEERAQTISTMPSVTKEFPVVIEITF